MPAFFCHQSYVPVSFIFLQGAEQLLRRLHGPQAGLIKQQLETEPENKTSLRHSIQLNVFFWHEQAPT